MMNDYCVDVYTGGRSTILDVVVFDQNPLDAELEFFAR